MFDNNWFVIDGFFCNDFLPMANVLNEFMDSEKKRILFSFYFFDLNDCPEDADYSKDDCISEGFEYFKERADSSINYIDLENKVMDMLCEEYTRIFEKCEVSTRDELYRMFIKDEISIFNECFIYSIKEYIARELYKPKKETYDFINERKVLENNIDISFKNNRIDKEENQRDLNYVWYEPKSKDDLAVVVDRESSLFKCIITEDIDDFNNYLYAFEGFEQADFCLAINDRVGNFESEILPKIKGFLSKKNVILKEKEYYRNIEKRCNDSKGI